MSNRTGINFGRAGFIVAVSFFFVSCGSMHILPADHGKDFTLEEDEERLWKEARKFEKSMDETGLLYTNESVVRYLNGVVDKLLPWSEKNILQFEVKVLKDPFLGAFTLTNGTIYMHTGILSKMENEAQLAVLLGHEMTHSIKRHALRSHRNQKNKRAALATFSTLTGGIGGLLGKHGTKAALMGYSRELEEEADLEGLKMMVSAGYDPREAPILFEHFLRDVQEQEVKEPFFFGTHPRLKNRIKSYSGLVQEKFLGRGGFIGEEEFISVMLPVILENSTMDLSMGRLSSAKSGIERFLKYEPENAEAHYYMGEIYRQAGDEKGSIKAEEEYRISIQNDDAFPEPHRSLGILMFKENRNKEAADEFRKYLALSPEAEDRDYIEQYIQQADGAP